LPETDPSTETGRAQDSIANSPVGYSGVEEHTTPFHAFLEYSTTLLFPVLFISCLYLSITHLYQLQRYWLAALGIPLGLVFSDLVTGLLHWAADTYGSTDTPILGQSIVKPFRLHHSYPRDITTHNLVTTVGNSCILAVPLLLLCLCLMWLMPHSGWLALIVVSLAVFAGASVATNQFHKWAHQEKSSAFARWLQRARIVLEPSRHGRHHTEPFNMHYCITNGWLNPLLDRIKFFRSLEAALRLLGIKTQLEKTQLRGESA
jgi:ubiquitin-conjugating enzyme E2 variant